MQTTNDLFGHLRALYESMGVQVRIDIEKTVIDGRLIVKIKLTPPPGDLTDPWINRN